MSEYYVYMYIDPRNFEEFYYGKGKGGRKDEHLTEIGDSEKIRRITEIHNAGLKPIIKVIASGLTEDEALLIESTLIWKLGRYTTNMASGHFSGKFRPHNTLHKELHGFDYENKLFYFNIGEDKDGHQVWEDFAEFGFIVAGGEIRFRDAIKSFNTGDIFAAYLKGRGFVGIGRITQKAEMVKDVRIGNDNLLDLKLRSKGLANHMHDQVLSDYACKVEWIKKLDRTEAKFISNSGLYTTPLVKASLEAQPKTIQYLEDEFGVSFDAILK